MKAAPAGYPLRGEILLENIQYPLGLATRDFPKPGTIWIDQRLRSRLAAKVGDRVQLGDATFTTQLSYARTLTEGGTDARGFGSAFDSNLVAADAALALPVWLGFRAEARLLVGYESFDEENAVQYAADQDPLTNPDPRRVRRRDTIVDTSVSLRRPLTDWLDLELRVRDTRHGSSAGVYDYDRQIAGTYLRFRFDR